MRNERKRYHIDGTDFDAVYNRNEFMVRTELKRYIENNPDLKLSPKDIQDVYALTLNDFPPHYVHRGTIVLFPNVRRADILHQIKRNSLFVSNRPKS